MDNGFDGNNQGFQENGGVSGGETERTEKNADQNQGADQLAKVADLLDAQKM